MTKRIINQASENKMTHIEGKVKVPDTIYLDIQILNLRERFMNDEEFILHLGEVLNLNLVIEEDKEEE